MKVGLDNIKEKESVSCVYGYKTILWGKALQNTDSSISTVEHDMTLCGIRSLPGFGL